MKPASQVVASNNASSRHNIYAIVSIILAGLGLFFGLVTSIPAIVCGHIALSHWKKQPNQYNSATKSLAMIGLILGYVISFFNLMISAFVKLFLGFMLVAL